MEKIPVLFEAINRIGVVVKPRKPFIDWLNYLYEDKDEAMVSEDNNIYLIREMDSNEEAMEWLKDNFEPIFDNELLDWNTDENTWPQNRTWQVFRQWFDVEICSMLLDMEDDVIEKD